MKTYGNFLDAMQEAMRSKSGTLIFKIPEQNHAYAVGTGVEARNRSVFGGVIYISSFPWLLLSPKLDLNTAHNAQLHGQVIIKERLPDANHHHHD